MDRLLKLLRENARLSHADIAARLGTTETLVTAQISQLEADGVILGYHTMVNAEKCGTRGVVALIEVKITPESGGGFDRIARRIAQYDQVRGCYLMSGGFDLAVMVEGKDLYDVAKFVAEKLSTLEVVLSTATHFQLRTYKHDGFLVDADGEEDRLPVTP
ncbi:MAG: Lrp/AsnC family transcriptional regulator [Roseimicrobium sp.]